MTTWEEKKVREYNEWCAFKGLDPATGCPIRAHDVLGFKYDKDRDCYVNGTIEISSSEIRKYGWKECLRIRGALDRICAHAKNSPCAWGHE